MAVFTSNDGINFTQLSASNTPSTTDNKIDYSFTPVTTQYIKVLLKNHGTIAEGNAGAGNKAWLFVSEIQIF